MANGAEFSATLSSGYSLLRIAAIRKLETYFHWMQNRILTGDNLLWLSSND
jgi:hypothetical protein